MAVTGTPSSRNTPDTSPDSPSSHTHRDGKGSSDLVRKGGVGGASAGERALDVVDKPRVAGTALYLGTPCDGGKFPDLPARLLARFSASLQYVYGGRVIVFDDESSLSDAHSVLRFLMSCPEMAQVPAFIWKGEFVQQQSSSAGAPSQYDLSSLPLDISSLVPGKCLALSDLSLTVDDSRHMTSVDGSYRKNEQGLYEVSDIRNVLSTETRHGFSKLHGRDQEFQAVMDAIHTGKILRIVGPAGTGKTRLMKSIIAHLQAAAKSAQESGDASASQYRFLPARADRQKAFANYSFLSSVFIPAFLEALSDSLSLFSQSSTLSRPLNVLRTFVQNPAAYLQKDLEGSGLTEALSRLFHACFAIEGASPLAIILDDAQWIDPKSREILNCVLPKTPDAVSVLVPERDHSGNAAHLFDSAQVLNLRNLPLIDASQQKPTQLFADLVSDAYQLPDGVEFPFTYAEAVEIARITDGNPLFLYHFLKAIENLGFVTMGAGRTNDAPLSFDALPKDHKSIFQSQLDKDFREPQRQVLQYVQAVAPFPEKLFLALLPQGLHPAAQELKLQGILVFDQDGIGLYHREFADVVAEKYGSSIRDIRDKVAVFLNPLLSSERHVAAFPGVFNPLRVYLLALDGHVDDGHEHAARNFDLRVGLASQALDGALASYDLPSAQRIYDDIESHPEIRLAFESGRFSLAAAKLQSLQGDDRAAFSILEEALVSTDSGISPQMELDLRAARRDIAYRLATDSDLSAKARYQELCSTDGQKFASTPCALSPDRLAMEQCRLSYHKALAQYRLHQYADFQGAATAFIQEYDLALEFLKSISPLPEAYFTIYTLVANMSRMLGNALYTEYEDRFRDRNGFQAALPQMQRSAPAVYIAARKAYQSFVARFESAPIGVTFDPQDIALAFMHLGSISETLRDMSASHPQNQALYHAEASRFSQEAVSTAVDAGLPLQAANAFFYRGLSIHNHATRTGSLTSEEAIRMLESFQEAQKSARVLRNPNLPEYYPAFGVASAADHLAKLPKKSGDTNTTNYSDLSVSALNEFASLALSAGRRSDFMNPQPSVHPLVIFSLSVLACEVVTRRKQEGDPLALESFPWLTQEYLFHVLNAFDGEISRVSHSDTGIALEGYRHYALHLRQRKAFLERFIQENFAS